MKKILLLILPLVLIPALLFFISSYVGQKKSSLPQTIPPTPTPFSVSSGASVADLRVVDVSPLDGSVNMPLDQKITLTFDKAVSEKDIVFYIVPEIPFSVHIQNNILTITPTEALLPGTTYKYSLHYKLFPLSNLYSFTTLGTAPTGEVESSLPQKNLRDNWNLAKHPDVFLDQQLPYEAASFTAVSNFSMKPNSHFAFIVTAKTTPTQAKQDFETWVTSLGITNNQLQDLDITYE